MKSEESIPSPSCLSNFNIEVLGEPTYDSPFKYASVYGSKRSNFVTDSQKNLYHVLIDEKNDLKQQFKEIKNPDNRMERAGPREKIYFNPKNVVAAIATCGGLCPGINDVIRAIVRSLSLGYKVENIWGFKYGFKGFLLNSPEGPIALDTNIVDDIHTRGGTILGSARGGGEKTAEIVDTLQRYKINLLFIIGGDGSQKGALAIGKEAQKRHFKLSVIGIPKTIDNDLSFVHKSFGFETAVSRAAESLVAAHIEAKGAYNGVGLVKVMGRESGFIAAQTALASQEANFVLIPEVPFELDGPNGFLKHLELRLQRKNHALVVVAEGAGADLLEAEYGSLNEHDAGGNKKMYDIGYYLREKIIAYFKLIDMDAQVRYIDPSYMIRASPPNANDAIYCARLGSNAVHAAMAGKTNMIISLWNGVYVHVPTGLATEKRNRLNPERSLWRDVIESSFQPLSMTNPK